MRTDLTAPVTTRPDIRATIAIGVFAALIIAGSYVVVPLPFSPVPLALQSLFVLLAAVVLGPRRGTLTVLLFLGMGAVGLPVFAGGQGGPAHFLRPTAGYLLGYLPAAAVAGAIAAYGRGRAAAIRRRFDALAATTGSIIIYATGVPVLQLITGMNVPAALTAGLLPFVPGDLIKVVIAAALADRLRRAIEPPTENHANA